MKMVMEVLLDDDLHTARDVVGKCADMMITIAKLLPADADLRAAVGSSTGILTEGAEEHAPDRVVMRCRVTDEPMQTEHVVAKEHRATIDEALAIRLALELGEDGDRPS